MRKSGTLLEWVQDFWAGKSTSTRIVNGSDQTMKISTSNKGEVALKKGDVAVVRAGRGGRLRLVKLEREGQEGR